MKPKLRFKEFSDEWEEKKLGDIARQIKTKNKELVSDNVLTISAQYGLISQSLFFNKNIASKDLSGYYLLSKNDFAYNKSYSKDYAFGAIKRLSKYNQGIVSALYICFTANNLKSNLFLEQFFESQKWNHYINGVAQEGARNHGLLNIAVNDFFDMPIQIPSLPEQEKIGEFFSLLDDRIEKQEQKINLLKERKKGWMQKLFNQEIRFKDENGNDYPDWEEKKLEEILEVRNEKISENKQFPLMAFTSKGGIEPKGDKYDRSFLVKSDNKLYKKTLYNDFIYSSNNLDVGSIGLNKYGDAVISDVYEIFKVKSQYNPDMISMIIQIPTNIHNILRYRQGALYGQYRIHPENFLKVCIQVPSLPEQQKIGAFLSKQDELIEAEERKLELLKEQKKGLLQQMFV